MREIMFGLFGSRSSTRQAFERRKRLRPVAERLFLLGLSKSDIAELIKASAHYVSDLVWEVEHSPNGRDRPETREELLDAVLAAYDQLGGTGGGNSEDETDREVHHCLLIWLKRKRKC